MYFATPKTMEWIEKLKQESKKNGTVGCVVLDKQGNLTAGTSTGGMFKKRWGRIGDSPVIGAGTYADNNSCAVSCTGHGEYFIRHAVAFDVCARYKYLKESVEKAADYIIHTELNTNAGNGGLIAVDKLGNIAMPYNSGGMFRGFLYKEKGRPEIKKGCGIGKKIVVVGESSFCYLYAKFKIEWRKQKPYMSALTVALIPRNGWVNARIVGSGTPM